MSVPHCPQLQWRPISLCSVPDGSRAREETAFSSNGCFIFKCHCATHISVICNMSIIRSSFAVSLSLSPFDVILFRQPLGADEILMAPYYHSVAAHSSSLRLVLHKSRVSVYPGLIFGFVRHPRDPPGKWTFPVTDQLTN